MKTLALLLRASCVALALCAAPAWASRHVVIVSVDGLRPDVALRAKMPVFRSLMDRGSFSMYAMTTDVAITLPSHTSMLTGVTPLKHGIHYNADPRPGDPPAPAWPTIFEVAVPVRPNFDVITSNESLAAAELYLAARPNRDRVLRERMMGADAYDVIVLDCSPSLSLLNQNALCYADSVLIPVSCDYLALVGVKQCVRTLKGVHEHLKHPVHILGVVPTFYDARHKLAREVTETLKQKFGDLCLAPVRANMKLREAPAAKQTIFEYAPDSNGAEDYREVVKAVVAATRQGARPKPAAEAVAQMEAV